MKKLIYLSCLLLLVGCGDDDEPTPAPMDNVAPDNPDDRELFIEANINSRVWIRDEFLFSDSAFFPYDTIPFIDLIEHQSDCRQDDRYGLSLLNGNLVVSIDDHQISCNEFEPSGLNQAIIYDLNDSLTQGMADFQNIDAINKFLDVGEPRSGNTSRGRYIMDWTISHLTKDSIVINGSFPDATLGVPSYRLKFVPI
ncbi:hypothetical protein [Tunicatimonas pelagia]|uniref:hypothetical protein n=1 Tax=Tunicatimonas pelagia TaxID=931531 RepID=UPI0026663203|nr:hypothetical protein [Tunicatimonas pelagia]WKN46481.1 hypothetical protein P0M28_30490 [Tunicatimonas pelagia]